MYAVLKDKVRLGTEEYSILDIMNPPSVFKDGIRQRNLDSTKDLLPLSGKLLPEFDKRRSIKDMLTRKHTSLPRSFAHESTALYCEDGPRNKPPKTPQSFESGEPPDACHSFTELSTRDIGNLPGKRHLEDISKVQSVKRSKSNGTSSTTRRRLKGQQSLKGFLLARPVTISSSVNGLSVDERHAEAKPTYPGKLCSNGLPP